MSQLGLDPLLTALRGAGLRVGFTEVARLRQVLATEARWPAGDEAVPRLKSLLRAVLVKSPEDGAVVDRLCDAWLEEGRGGELSAPPPRRAGRSASPPRRGGAPRWLLAAAAALILGAVAIVQPWAPPPPTVTPAPPPPAPPGEIELPSPEDMRQRTTPSWQASFEVTPPQAYWTGRPAVAWGLLALLSGGGLWLAASRRRWLPEPEPPPAREGPPRVFLTPPVLDGDPQLLDAGQQDALVWGIGQFVSDEPTRHLDLAATVRATAKAAGVARLCFEHARYQREVWLWLDDAATDTTLRCIAAEIETALEIHGLPVERAEFRGVPERLVAGDGRVFAPREVDERRGAALVAILTDGRALTRQYLADNRRVQLDALLRSLSCWPRLAFVDFSAGTGDGLRRIVEPHGIDVIAPQEMAPFLGGAAGARRAASALAPDDVTWAAACALAPSPIGEAAALELRRRLGSGGSPWALRGLRSEASGPAGRLRWSPKQRVRRLRWLATAETGPGAAVAEASSLGRALCFWEETYDQELERRVASAEWAGSPAHQRLRLERALVRLWRFPGEAVRELYRLHAGPLAREIRQRLAELAPAGAAGGQLVPLPWRWPQRSAAEQVMLRTMGLGGAEPAASLRRPGRLWLGLGWFLGLAVAALVAAPWLRQVPAGRPAVVHRGGPTPGEAPAGARVAVEPSADGLPAERPWTVRATLDDQTFSTAAAAGSRVTMLWAPLLDLGDCRFGDVLPEDGFAWVRVCPGTFQMGSPEDEAGRWDDEGPLHEVTISRELWIAQTETTNVQYRSVNLDHQGVDNLPVVNVSWTDANRFCTSLGHRLPTEGEWEYAARAGTQTRFSFGDDESELDDYAWYASNSGGRAHPVGEKDPNRWGLHDMHGNVYEWVQDWWAASYQSGPQVDPTGPVDGQFRVWRGGSFIYGPRNLRSAYRGRGRPEYLNWYFGFRCVRAPHRQP